MQLAIPHLHKNQGNIVNISSVTGSRIFSLVKTVKVLYNQGFQEKSMVTIDGNSLTIQQVFDIGYKRENVQLADSAIEYIEKSRKFVEKILRENRTIYGINTGFGELANTSISAEDAATLQENLIRSHAVGVGEPLPEDIVRAMILLRANALAKGYSGVRRVLIDFLVNLLNNNVYPFIPSKGSVGASGDLAPLSHLALFIMGEGEGIINGLRRPANEVLAQVGMKPLKLQAKEGLGLINGTQMMSAIGCLVTSRSELLLKNAQIAGSMSLEALKGTARAFDEKVHALRPHPGQVKIAGNLRRLIEDSKIVSSHKDCDKVQDAYTLRCMPQVLGAIADTIEYGKKVLQIEINSATDNPLIFATEGEVISGGNFHGEPLAFIMDYLGVALSEIANISERTTDRLVNPYVSGLPPFLAKNSGLNSGFMITQYTAAALVSENKILAHPASVDSIPTSAGQEDHVSMGSISARKAISIMENVEYVLAIEMLCAAQGIDFHDQVPGRGTRAAHRCIRQHVGFVENDRILYRYIEKLHQMVVDGTIVKAVEQVIGNIN